MQKLVDCDGFLCGWAHAHCFECACYIDGKNTVSKDGKNYCTKCADAMTARECEQRIRGIE